MKGKKVSSTAERCHSAAPIQQTPNLLTAKQAAGRLNISYSSFRRWCKEPTFPKAFHYGSVQRWRLEDIDAFIVAHLQKTEVA